MNGKVCFLKLFVLVILCHNFVPRLFFSSVRIKNLRKEAVDTDLKFDHQHDMNTKSISNEYYNMPLH